MKVTCPVALTAAICAGVSVSGQLVIGVTIEEVSSELTLANSGYDRLASHVVDGSGLVGFAHVTGSDGGMWDADVFSPPLGAGNVTDAAPFIVFDLGVSYSVDRLRIWNYNERGYLGRGVRDLTVSFSTDNTSYSFLGSFVLAAAPGSDDYTGEVVEVTNFEGRYVRFDIQSSQIGNFLNNGLGLAEVQFFAVPEPSLGAFAAGLICLVTGLIRREASTRH